MRFVETIFDMWSRLREWMAARWTWLDNSLALGQGKLFYGGKKKRGFLDAFARHMPALRSGWRKYGYYAALAALLCVLGVASVNYRSQSAKEKNVQESELIAPNPVEIQEDMAVAAQPEAADAQMEFVLPVQGVVAQEFSPNTLVWSDTLNQWQTHGGVDIACQAGEAVCAAADGTVTDAYEDALFGYVVEIDHGDGWVTRYASLSTIQLVNVGQKVKRGDVISAAGATAMCESAMGSHVHVELYQDGEPVDILQWVHSA